MKRQIVTCITAEKALVVLAMAARKYGEGGKLVFTQADYDGLEEVVFMESVMGSGEILTLITSDEEIPYVPN